MITFACIYFLTPRLWGREKMHSMAAINWHFWLATIGIVLYASSMWVTGIMEGLMWREVDDQGFLVNSFADTVSAKFPMYVVRGLGGVMFLSGALIMVLEHVDDDPRCDACDCRTPPRNPCRIRTEPWQFLTNTQYLKKARRCC